MYFSAPTLDDLLRPILIKLLDSRNLIEPTKGPATELTGVLLKLTKPRSRLSRTEMKGTLFSCLGELLWYLGKTNKLNIISYYLPGYDKFSDDGRTIYGGYGPRMFDMRGRINQVANVIDLLKRKPDSRQAVIQLFDAADILKEHKDVPCTCTLQFMIRRGHLQMLTNMRSNDAYVGLPHDVFAFTMVQELMAQTLGVGLGTYSHAVGSLHLYKDDRDKASKYLREGWQSTIAMPPMPDGDPWPAIRKVLRAERVIRRGGTIDVGDLHLDEYWADMVRLLQIFRYSKDKKTAEVSRLKRKIRSQVYGPYIEKRLRRKPAVTRSTPRQLRLPGAD